MILATHRWSFSRHENSKSGRRFVTVMKTIVTIVYCSLASICMAGSDLPLDTVRVSFYRATLDPELSIGLSEQLDAQTSTTPLEQAYLGASRAVMIKTTWNLWYKYKWLDQASATLNQAVNDDPNNVEIRFLRYSVEWHVPAYLGYSDHLTEDRSMIMGNLESFMSSDYNPEIKAYIQEFMQREQ